MFAPQDSLGESCVEVGWIGSVCLCGPVPIVIFLADDGGMRPKGPVVVATCGPNGFGGWPPFSRVVASFLKVGEVAAKVDDSGGLCGVGTEHALVEIDDSDPWSAQ